MKIAVEGCAHGELETIYDALENIQRRDNIKIDLLLCCGDFQAVRNEADLACMAVPPKYKKMCSFYKYYNGEKKAPILTIFIGGNHEASNHLWELPFGGWVAPNIYYLGYSGVVKFGGFRIAGLSGIYKANDYNMGHYESPPFNQGTLRSIYHVRSLDVFKLKMLTSPVDIAMSHDWPKGVYHYGNLEELYRWKAFLREEIESNTLGSYGAQEVLRVLQPDFWFSAHLHCRFPAQVLHSQTDKVTNFLALDKCLPRRKYLEVIDLGREKGPLELSYDPEWLAITKSTLPLLNTEQVHTKLPYLKSVIETLKPNKDTIKEIKELFGDNLKIPENFAQNVPLYNPAKHKKHVQVAANTNPQTDTFCQTLRIRNPFWGTDLSENVTSENPDEINLSDEDDDTQSNNFSGYASAKFPGPRNDGNVDSSSHVQSVPKQDNLSSKIPEEIAGDDDSQSTDFVSDASTTFSSTEDGAKPDFRPIQKRDKAWSENLDEIGLADDEESESQSSVSLGKPEHDDKTALGNKLDRSSDSEPPPKVFKLVRRNQTMYSTTEDSDD